MPKIKTKTSMCRAGEPIKENTEIDVPKDEAVALVTNGLAEPVGWKLSKQDEVPKQETTSDDSAI